MESNLFNYFFDQYYVKDFQSEKPQLGVELYLTNKCNLKCSYCYLMKYPQLYPQHDNETVIKNLRMLLEYFKENKFHFKRLDIFSGEILGMPLGVQVLEVLYEYFSEYRYTDLIGWPTNASFLLNEKSTEQIKFYINRFRRLGINLGLSLSVDGPYLDDDNRSFKVANKKRNQEYYDKLIDFANEYGFLFHPMISAINIDRWIPNYDWFVESYNKMGYDPNALMSLEVRNDDWTDEAIAHYEKLLTHMFNRRFNEFYNKDPHEFLRIYNNEYMLRGEITTKLANYDILKISPSYDGISCSIQKTLMIRVADLAIVPCHRTAYDKFVAAKLYSDENKVSHIGATALNPLPWIKIQSLNPSQTNILCEKCAIKNQCSKGCLGAQYESQQDILSPIPSVCRLFKRRIKILYDLYESNGILDAMLDPRYRGSFHQLVHELRSIQEDFYYKHEVVNYEQ